MGFPLKPTGSYCQAGEEEQLVLDHRSADLAAETVVVETRIEGRHAVGEAFVSADAI